jgi:hypothetical protein
MNITEKVQRLYQAPSEKKQLTNDQEILIAEYKEQKSYLSEEVRAFIENTVAKYPFFKVMMKYSHRTTRYTSCSRRWTSPCSSAESRWR